MTKEDIKTLSRQRASVKGKLTNFRAYFDIQKTCAQLSELQLDELELRLQRFTNIYDEFDDLQNKLDLVVDDSAVEEQQKERASFETEYYSIFTEARLVLNTHRSRFPRPDQDLNSEVGSSANQANNFVRLPKIDLPHFDGSYQNWLEFRDTYLSIIHNNTSISDINKFHYLRAALKGSAAIVIQSLDFSANNYSTAWKLLSERYDNNKLLINNHLNALFSLEPLQRESCHALRNIIDVTNKNLRALNTLGQPTDHWDTLIIYIMSKKLDNVTNREWEENKNIQDDYPTLQTFLKFLVNRAIFLESIEESKNIKTLSEKKPDSMISHKSKSFVVSQPNNKPSSYHCPMCKKDHFLYQCPVFRKFSAETRLQKAKLFKVCLNCLRHGHSDSTCRLSHCKYCSFKHHTLLHIESQNTPNNSQPEAVVLTANKSNNQSGHILLSTAIVNVLDTQGKTHTARILLDNGSTANFITQDLCNNLKIHTSTIQLNVTGINNQTSKSTKSCKITIQSLHGGYRTDINCFVLPSISTLLPTTYINIEDIQIPTAIHLADPSFNIPSVVDILVGAEVFWQVIGTSKIQLGKQKPTLHETKFGWLVSGSIGQDNAEPTCLHIQQKADIHDSNMTRFWELDTIPNKYHMTSDENACEDSFTSNTIRNPDGRFVVTIPLKESPNALGDSYQLARKRFLSLERRLERETRLKELYIEFMDEYISLGHMSLSSKSNTQHSISCYLPHHGVLKESRTTTKLRVVFDASARTASGKSFNDIQRVGPTVQDDLLSILLRFRQHVFVVTADIEKMYRQIDILDSQRSLQQILWRSDPTKPLRAYTLNTVTYGTASAPYLATRCLTQLGNDSTNENIQRAICHDFYVDDFLSGADSASETISLCQGVKQTLESAKFNLRKWHSNSEDILRALHTSTNDRSNSVDLSSNDLSKTLGLNWKCSDDTLTFKINISQSEKVTKRIILSTVAQVFDPLGLVSPCIVEAKIIMQQLWVLNCAWDDEVPNSIKLSWQEFVKSLSSLNYLNIPRCIKYYFTTETTIHTFTDASEKAYGACIYVRTVRNDGSVTVRLLVSKSKVAPKKPVTTIPRLELSAALLGCRLCVKVLSSLTLQCHKCVYWTDSTITLYWIATPPSKLKSFVRHRVSEIQENTSGQEWRYVSSKENPADLVSRGLSADKLGSTNIWWNGPSFLSLDEGNWPINIVQDKNTIIPEVKSLHTNTDENIFTTLINETSNLNKLQRIVAFIFRFIHNTRKHTQTKHTQNLTLQELHNSTTFLLRVSQQESFPTEKQALLSGQSLPSKNRLLPLSPFVDEDKLIRVGGRLSNSNYDYNLKHPVLLCAKHRLTKLIFEMLHKINLHAGPQLLLATVRHNYWALGGRNLAKHTVRACVKCCRIKGETIQPIMGNLPKQRVEIEYPFIESGVDYAGPVMISDRKGRGSKLIKSYICAFVCLATKALHLELVSDLTKEAYIAALNRFVSRRGKPKSIISDNGTTFQGAFNELSRLLNQTLSSQITEKGINFSFIPAYTPHFGGLWESAIKSIKHHLRRVLDMTHLTYEEMSTLLIQVEAILNSRPLTPLSDDPSDLYPLTPSHFLIGRSLTCVPHPQIMSSRVTSLQRFQRIELLKQHFWNRFSNEYILWLQNKTKWRSSKGELKEGTLVLVKDKALPPLMWLLGRVIRGVPGNDGVVRVADIKTKKGVIRRAYNNICPLPIHNIEDQALQGRQNV